MPLLVTFINNLEQANWFKNLHRFIIPRSKVGTRLLQIYAGLIFLPALVGIYVMWQIPTEYFPLYDQIARQAGQVAAVLYGLTLIPGMLRRFGILPLTRSILMIWRRYIGIAMFHSAIVHQLLIRTVPLLFINPGLLMLYPGRQTLFGLLGLIVLFPLWLTSNDWSVKRLGRWWHHVHALTYLALFLIYLHVSLATTGWVKSYLLVIMGLEVASFIVRLWPRASMANSSNSSITISQTEEQNG